MPGPRICAHPDCSTHLSRYNDDLFCASHERYNQQVRMGLPGAKRPCSAEEALTLVPEERRNKPKPRRKR